MGCDQSGNGGELPPFTAVFPEHVLANYLDRSVEVHALPGGQGVVMPWKDDLLPDVLADYVRDISDRAQCPPDFVAVALVVSISAVVGRKRTIHPKQHDDWLVVPNLWGVIVGRPSAMKSPALKQAVRPLAALADREKEKYGRATSEHKTASELLDMERKIARKQAEKLISSDDRGSAQAMLSKFSDDIQPPSLRRYLINDCTVEKLGELLNENPNGLLLVRDELAGWLSTLQTEDGAVARAFYLECFDGNGSFVYDRIGRGTVFIDSCCVSLVGGIQPSRIAALIRAAVTGEMDDGLIQRLQLAVCPDDDRDWSFVDRWPNKSALERVSSVINDLDQIPDEPRHSLRFSLEAQALFNGWYVRHMRLIKNSGLHSALESHFMKMPQTIASLALLFELIEGGRESVGVEAITRALDWCEYLKSHAERFYGAAINAPLMGAKIIFERRKKLPEPFTPREVRSKNWAGLDTTQAVMDALAVLTEHNILIGYEVASDTGGRPSRRYVWRPSHN